RLHAPITNSHEVCNRLFGRKRCWPNSHLWRLMLHLLHLCCTRVASDEIAQAPMFIRVVPLLHLKCAPGGGKVEKRLKAKGPSLVRRDPTFKAIQGNSKEFKAN